MGWLDKFGREASIEEMTDNHLLSTIRLLTLAKLHGNNRPELKIMRKEAKSRGLFLEIARLRQ